MLLENLFYLLNILTDIYYLFNNQYRLKAYSKLRVSYAFVKNIFSLLSTKRFLITLHIINN